MSAAPKHSRRIFLISSLVLEALPLAARAVRIDGPALRGLDDADGGDIGAPFVDVGEGVLVQDVPAPAGFIAKGSAGATVSEGAVVSVKWVLRRSNGYLIWRSFGGAVGNVDEDFVFRVGRGEAVEGFEKALQGMQAGGRRRFVVPPRLGYVGGVKAGKNAGPLPPEWGARRSLSSHASEPLLFEVLISRVKI